MTHLGGTRVTVYLQFLRHAGELQDILKRDGWTLQPEKDQSQRARHSSVADETSARSRLHRLGLLTSASMRISFTSGELKAGATDATSRGRSR
jgi:hypothetical protein